MLMAFMRHSPDLRATVFGGQTGINLLYRPQLHPPSFVKIISHLNGEECEGKLQRSSTLL